MLIVQPSAELLPKFTKKVKKCLKLGGDYCIINKLYKKGYSIKRLKESDCMKKKQLLLVCVVMIFIGVGLAILKTNVHAFGDYDHSNLRNSDCDIVKDVDISEFDGFLPILSALGAHIHNEEVEYHPFQGNFYEVDLSYLLAYMKDTPLVEYTEDADNYYLDSVNADKLTNYAFCEGAYEALYDFGKNSEAYYDNQSHLFVVRKRDFPMDYSVKVTNATYSYGETWGEDFGYYDLNAILYKGEEAVATMKYQIEYEDGEYSVVDAAIVR